MTYTEKVLAEFDERFNIFGECNPPHCHNMRWGGNFDDLKSFLATSITQAVAEDRARVRGNLPEIRVSALSLLFNDCSNCGQVINMPAI